MSMVIVKNVDPRNTGWCGSVELMADCFQLETDW